MEELQEALPRPGAAGSLTSRADLRAALVAFGEGLLQTLMRDDMLAVLRLTVGEMIHIPELRPTFVQAHPRQLRGRTQHILEAAAANRVIRLDHPDISVRMLVGPLMSFVFFNGLMAQGSPARPPSEVIEWLVDTYLRTLDFVDEPRTDAS